MTAICADDLLRARERADVPDTRAETPRATRGAVPAAARPRPLRYEDFERRSDTLADTLGGRVFPRLP